MSRRILHLVAEILWFCILSGLAFAQLQEPLPKLNYDMTADFFQLPPAEHLVEPAGIAVNSKGHIYVFHRGKHPLIEFDSSGKFIRSIADELFVKRTCGKCFLSPNLTWAASAAASSCEHPVRCNTYVLEEPRWLFSESTFRLSSAFLYTTRSSLDLAYQTIQE